MTANQSSAVAAARETVGMAANETSPGDAVFTVDLSRLKIENMEIVGSGYANDREFFRDVSLHCLLTRKMAFWRRDGELCAGNMDDIVDLFWRAEPVILQKPAE